MYTYMVPLDKVLNDARKRTDKR